ncbi:MAG TPA: inositol monophosphatase family protein [Aliidongia sp.]|uniref:inositol monophosphatase family protein n=1 Tax=Aliidongia sp. TaxID=1914230 RepID=UPI002DDDAFC7|nr:inositol monophosphatase family protein [Aliidongia sp.]HEV2677694.1 inositol monophosphatase family protein [Aliidongia sp.]
MTQPASEPALDAFLDQAIAAARAGAEVIRRGALDRDRLTIERKKANDFVSEVDRNAEDAIIASLAARFPDHGFIAEESGVNGDAEFTWLIDPLDGTTNFLHGIPHYCTSIGLRHAGRIVVGVILDSAKDHLFTATEGGGAFLDGEPIRVAVRDGLDEAVIGTGFPFTDWSYFDAYMDSLRDVMRRCAGIRRAGAAALDLAYVASGWLDGFWEMNLNAWDVAAGSLLIREAGGIVTDFAGAGDFIARRQIVAGGPATHAALLARLDAYPGLRVETGPR